MNLDAQLRCYLQEPDDHALGWADLMDENNTQRLRARRAATSESATPSKVNRPPKASQPFSTLVADSEVDELHPLVPILFAALAVLTIWILWLGPTH